MCFVLTYNWEQKLEKLSAINQVLAILVSWIVSSDNNLTSYKSNL